MDDLSSIQGSIDALLESNRRDRRTFADHTVRPEERGGLQKAIASREAELRKLVEQKWAILKVMDQ
jgi:hypothetical protein